MAITTREPGGDILYPVAVVGIPAKQEQEWWVSRGSHQAASSAASSNILARWRAKECFVIDNAQTPLRASLSYGLVTMLVVLCISHDQIVGYLIEDYGGETIFIKNKKCN